MPDTDSESFEIQLDLDWHAELIGPNTPTDDDPNENIPEGWWIFGYGPSGETEAEMHVRGIYNVHDDDVSEQCARLIVDMLNKRGVRRG